LVSTSVLAAAKALDQALGGCDPEQLSPAECAAVAEKLAVTEKACASVRLVAATRAVGGGAHRERGFTDGASWLARQSGTTGSQARQALKIAGRLEGLPEVKDALLAGDISLAQATEIAGAAADSPGVERELLPVARQSDLTQLRDRARECRQAKVDPAELRHRQFASRQFRHWRDREGMVHLAATLPPEIGLPLVRRVEVTALRLRRTASKDREAFEAHAADALAQLVGGAQHGRSLHAELVIVSDLFAWRRGHTHPGEVCHIIGGGPIPVDVARELSNDAFVKAVLHDGVNIHTVKHFGRNLPAPLKTALDLGPIPDFTGRQCVDCGRRDIALEYDHVNPVANGGPTQYINLKARCWIDHQHKTEQDRRAGLLGPHPPSRPAPKPRDTSSQTYPSAPLPRPTREPP